MALVPTVLFDAVISINSNVISDHGNKISIPIMVAAEDTSAFGSQWQSNVGGQRSATLSATFMNDFQDGNLDEEMFALIGTVVAFSVKATSDAVSATNPSYSGNILINGWTPLGGDVAKLTTVDISYPTSGAVVRATS